MYVTGSENNPVFTQIWAVISLRLKYNWPEKKRLMSTRNALPLQIDDKFNIENYICCSFFYNETCVFSEEANNNTSYKKTKRPLASLIMSLPIGFHADPFIPDRHRRNWVPLGNFFFILNIFFIFYTSKEDSYLTLQGIPTMTLHSYDYFRLTQLGGSSGSWSRGWGQVIWSLLQGYRWLMIRGRVR